MSARDRAVELLAPFVLVACYGLSWLLRWRIPRPTPLRRAWEPARRARGRRQ